MEHILNGIDEIIQKKIDQLEDNDKKVKGLLKQLEESRLKQKEEFFDLAKKIEPLITFYQENKYIFTNESFNKSTTHGPIVGYNSRKNILYVYIRGDLLTAIDGNTKEEIDDLRFEEFIQENSFEEAMSGLFNVIILQDRVIKIYDDKIAKIKDELEQVYM